MYPPALSAVDALAVILDGVGVESIGHGDFRNLRPFASRPYCREDTVRQVFLDSSQR